MDFNLTSEQKRLRDSIVKFAQGELNRDVIERDRDQVFSRELWRQCAAIGLLGLPVPEEDGGAGADPLSCAIALEALGYGCRDGGLVGSKTFISSGPVADVVVVFALTDPDKGFHGAGPACSARRWTGSAHCWLRRTSARSSACWCTARPRA